MTNIWLITVDVQSIENTHVALAVSKRITRAWAKYYQRSKAVKRCSQKGLSEKIIARNIFFGPHEGRGWGVSAKIFSWRAWRKRKPHFQLYLITTGGLGKRSRTTVIRCYTRQPDIKPHMNGARLTWKNIYKVPVRDVCDAKSRGDAIWKGTQREHSSSHSLYMLEETWNVFHEE